MKSLTCERCKGTGLYKNLGSCIQCNGAGVLTESRLLSLRDDYWPKRIADYKISPVAGSREIEAVEKLLQQLYATPEDEAESVTMVTNTPADDDDPWTRPLAGNIEVRPLETSAPAKIIEMDNLFEMLGKDLGWTSGLITVVNRAKKKGIKGRIAFVEET